MLHYYAKDFFAPVIVSPRLSEAHEVQIFVISDLSTDIHSAKVGIKVYNLASFEPVYVDYLTNLTIVCKCLLLFLFHFETKFVCKLYFPKFLNVRFFLFLDQTRITNSNVILVGWIFREKHKLWKLEYSKTKLHRRIGIVERTKSQNCSAELRLCYWFQECCHQERNFWGKNFL